MGAAGLGLLSVIEHPSVKSPGTPEMAASTAHCINPTCLPAAMKDALLFNPCFVLNPLPHHCKVLIE